MDVANALRCPRVRMLHDSQDKIFVESKIVQHLVEARLFQMSSVLSGGSAVNFLAIMPAFYMVFVLLVTELVHPLLNVMHPTIVHQSSFFASQWSLQVLVFDFLCFIQMRLIFFLTRRALLISVSRRTLTLAGRWGVYLTHLTSPLLGSVFQSSFARRVFNARCSSLESSSSSNALSIASAYGVACSSPPSYGASS